MNASTTHNQAASGTPRIRVLSQILKAILLTYLVVLPLAVLALSMVVAGPSAVVNYSLPSFAALPVGEKIVALVSVIIYLLGAVTFYRLLNLYEAGIFFARANVRRFRHLGYLAFSKGLLAVVATVVVAGKLTFPLFLFELLGSPWVMGGLFGVMVSLIMDEGCRLHEEQELTV